MPPGLPGECRGEQDWGPALSQLTVQRHQTHAHLQPSSGHWAASSWAFASCVAHWSAGLRRWRGYGKLVQILRTQRPPSVCLCPEELEFGGRGGAGPSSLLGVLLVSISGETQNIPEGTEQGLRKHSPNETVVLGNLLSPQHIHSDSSFACSVPPEDGRKGGHPCSLSQ